MTARTRVHPPGTVGPDSSRPSVDRATRRRRLLRLTGVLIGTAVRIRVMSRAGRRTQRRIAVCAAAGVLTALGVRVEVVNPSAPWPRTGRGHLVVSDSGTWLDELALLVAVRATPVADAAIGDRALVGGLARRLGAIPVSRDRPRSVAAAVDRAAALLRRGEPISVRPGSSATRRSGPGRFSPPFFQAAVDAGALVCPVAIRHRAGGVPAPALPAQVRDGTLLGSIVRIAALRDLVVEVHLLPALDASAGGRRALAALAQHAVAQVAGTGRPVAVVRPGAARSWAPAAGRPPGQPRRGVPDAA
ncbi:lysophospholipid acyltransferase family protein [Blastococcus xanthinilyticus]|uniref:Acyltransferase-like protein n=1 Tax=Blastococcus xanthinilyticus TaxID=1564164 RepID=A0A5S5D0H9_9ACTN|nr:1-acyl-sn-glycerol-3-phosphate acyltransferase [Blastococcus xanthinilyticus]TYP89543.1 acyltransferase-like protein [Blastococcus xanthinilyticus]